MEKTTHLRGITTSGSGTLPFERRREHWRKNIWQENAMINANPKSNPWQPIRGSVGIKIWDANLSIFKLEFT
jgi:hypothetical protein